MSQFKLEVVPDTDPMNPRKEYDHLGKMVCFHNRYELGDKTDLKSSMFGSWEELKQHLIKKEKASVILPIYMYDHSGLTVKTSPFSCPWDSGQIGFIYCTDAQIRSNYCVKRITAPLRVMVHAALDAEVLQYDKYLRGDYWGYNIINEDEEVVESCFGFDDEDYCRKEGEAALENCMLLSAEARCI